MSRIVKHPAIALLDSGTTLKEVRQIHAKLLVDGTLKDDHLVGQFVKAVALSDQKYLDYANQILDRSYKPTLFALNSMIRAHCKSPVPEKSFDFYRRIVRSENDLKPDNYTVNFLVQACTGLGLRETGLQVHGVTIRRGFDNDPHVQTGLISFYAELGCLDSCHKVFNSVSYPDFVCRTAMVTTCARCGDVAFARKLFEAGEDPFKLVKDAIKVIRVHMNTFKLMEEKSPPGIVDKFGWCTWDAFYLTVNPDGVHKDVKCLVDGGCPPGLVLIDDGWQSIGHDKDGIDVEGMNITVAGEQMPCRLVYSGLPFQIVR